jgi:hypothetical protein
MRKLKGRWGIPILLLLLTFTLVCTVNAFGQDKILITTTNDKVANSASVNCTVWADPPANTVCKAGQYFHSDGATPTSNWTPIATGTSYGAWTISPNNGAQNRCLSCHHGTLTNFEANGMSTGGAYLIGGHKNILRKVVPGQTLLNSEGVAVTTVVDHNGGLWTMDWATGTAGGNRAFYLAGWIEEPDLFGDFGQTVSGIPYGSCGRCHTTGYRPDDNGPEPTLVTPGTPNTYTHLTAAQFPRLPAGSKADTPTGVNGPAGSWSLTGIQCERCHKADMQYDGSVINPTYNVSGTATPTNGRVSHLVSLFVDPANVDIANCAWSAERSRWNCPTNSVTAGDFDLPSVSPLVSVAGTPPTASDRFTGRPVPKAPYALLCVECHQAYSTWTAKTVGQVGQTHVTPMPGFESLATPLDSANFTSSKLATGQFSATFACPGANPPVTTVTNPTNYFTACTDNGGTVTYKPGGMSHGVVTTILNSPHARVSGYVDFNNAGTVDTSLTIKGGTANVKVGGVTTEVNVSGKFNTHFASEAGVSGSCMGCHDIHGYLEGYVPTEAVNVKETLRNCTECHADHGQGMAHPTGPGTPYPDGQYGSQESCNICHFSKVSGTQYHFLRINPDPNYNTFPSAETYYTIYKSGQFAPLNTYNSGETYTDAGGVARPYPAVALDVDIACGQCHIGGATNKNPYGLVPPAGIPAFSRALLAARAAGMHNTQAPKPNVSPAPGVFGDAAPLDVTITASVPPVEGSPLQLFYTLDGTVPSIVVGPTYSSYVPNNAATVEYTGTPISLTTTKTVAAIQVGKPWSYKASQPAGGTYTIQSLAKPTMTPTGGTYTYPATATVTMWDAVPGTTIFFTRDGSAPGTAVGGSTEQYDPLAKPSLNQNATLKAIATKDGYAPSAIATGTAFTFKLPAPKFVNTTPAKFPGTYYGAVQARLTDALATAQICYSLTTTPVVSGGACTVGTAVNSGDLIPVAASGTLRAIAFGPGYAPSTMVSGVFTIR